MNLRVAVMMTLTVIQIKPNREEPRSATPGLSSKLAPLAHSDLADTHDPSSLGKTGFSWFCHLIIIDLPFHILSMEVGTVCNLVDDKFLHRPATRMTSSPPARARLAPRLA